MTTNVFDTTASVLASDSRWSGQVDGYFFFVDNSGYDKIVFDSHLALLFAGGLGSIDVWKNWFKFGRFGTPPPVSNDLSLCLVDMKSGVIRKDHGIKLDSPCKSARFAGTGSPHALQCWTANQDARKSVTTACKLDMASGGKVSYLVRETQENNLENHGTVDHLISSFLPRGEMIMVANTTRVAIPIQDAIKDPAANDAFQKLMAGGAASVCAPFIGMGTPWTQAEEDDLYAILSEYPPESK